MKKVVVHSITLVFLLLATVQDLYAHTETDTVSYVLKNDTAQSDTLQYLKAEPRGIDHSSVEKYKNDSEYNYDYTPPEESESFLDRLLRWIAGNRPVSSGLDTGVDLIFYLVITFAVIMIIYLIVSGNFTGIVTGAAKKTAAAYTVADVDIDTINFDELIAEAIAQKEFRRAVRLYYLQTLKLLSDKHLIEFKPDKTNADYLREFKKAELKQEFARLTYVYEYVWYGHFEINESNLVAATKAFTDFKTTLKP